MRKYSLIAIVIVALIIGVTFTLKNSQETVLSYYFGIEWTGPLSWLLIATFIAGIICGMLAVLMTSIKRKLFPKRSKKAQA